MSTTRLLLRRVALSATLFGLGCSSGAADENVRVEDRYFHTQGASIVNASGDVVRLTGLSWYGFELEQFALHGLHMRNMGDLLDLVKELGYNVIRVPFSNEFLDGKPPVDIDYAKNPELVGLQGLALLDALVDGAKHRGLRIILDRHRPTSVDQSPLWYTDEVPEEKWIADWVMLAEHFKDEPTVIGADLHNEPYGAATWGTDDLLTDWRLAAERAGEAILAIQPNWLITVEGIEVVDGRYYWWGGNLRAAGRAPVRLSIPNRVVYSTHDYPETLFRQPWFSDPTYPENLPTLWHDTWGYLVEEGIAPVWVGEFGTRYETESDRLWFNAILDYMTERDMSFAVWVLNADSESTGGLLLEDWITVRAEKQAVIAPSLAPPLE